MIVLDTNVLIYAADEHSQRYGKVRAWMQRALDDGEIFGVPWASLLGFVRITTLPSILAKPLSVEQALAYVEQLLGSPQSFVILDSGSQHYPGFARLLRSAGIAGNLTNDAHIASVALANGGRLATFDRDFSRFDGIQIIIPD